MGYRDDGLRARIDELEASLEGARRELAQLRGEGSPLPVDAAPSTLLGAPTRYVREEVLPIELSDAALERIAAILRDRLGLQPAQVGRSLHAGTGFRLEPVEGGTRIRLAGDWSLLPAGVVAAGIMTLLIPGVPVAAALVAAGAHGMACLAAQLAWVVPAIALGGALFTRRRARRQALTLSARFADAFEAIVAAARAEAPSVAGPRVRVPVTEDEPVVEQERLEPGHRARSE